MRGRSGFSLVELVVSLVLLVIVATTFAQFAGGFSRTMGDATLRTTQAAVAAARLELVRADPRYTQLVALYGTGPGADTTGFPGFAQMRRRTRVTRSQTPSRDRTTVTITVTHPAVRDTVSVTAVIASP